MARRHLESVLSSDEQDLDEVWDWYRFQSALIGEENVRTLEALQDPGRAFDPRYFGKSRAELDELFEFQRSELGRVTMLGILAACEAALRVDYIVRVVENKKDTISREFTAIYKEFKLEVGLEDQILEAWKRSKDSPRTAAAIGEFKVALRLRHWLAHGRYWKPKLGRQSDPQDVFDLSDELLRAIGIR